MSFINTLGDDDVNISNGGRASNLDLPTARTIIDSLVPGKAKRFTVPTGEIIEEKISEKTGKVINKSKVGRGTVEYGVYLALDAVGKEDVEGRKLNITTVRLGMDNDPQSPTVGQDVTQFRVWWGDKRDMTPGARTGLNRRILQTQTTALAERVKAVNAAKTPLTLAEHGLAVAKLEYTKARIRSEYRPDNADLAADAEAKKVAIVKAEQAVKEAKTVPGGAPDDIDKLLAELQSDPEPAPAPAPAAKAPAKPASQR